MDLIFPTQKQALQTNYINHYIDKNTENTQEIYFWDGEFNMVLCTSLKICLRSPPQIPVKN